MNFDLITGLNMIRILHEMNAPQDVIHIVFILTMITFPIVMYIRYKQTQDRR